MADSDWATLKQRCVDHAAALELRVETIADEQRYSLAARSKTRPNPVVFDIRSQSSDSAPQYAITQLVTRALEEWWA